MTSQQLFQAVYIRLDRCKWYIVGTGILIALLFVLYAARSATKYTSHASVFPLTATRDNNLANSALSSLLGITDGTQSFSQEASINIVELATSRYTLEAVASQRLPQMDNKTIGELLIIEYNKYRNFWNKEMPIPKDSVKLAAAGGGLLKFLIESKINKNGVLEITFTSSNKELVSPVSYVFIDKLSAFYKELRVKKAEVDYKFTLQKIDSLDNVLRSFDQRAVKLSNTTLFVPSEKIQYQIPKENLSAEKDRVVRQRDAIASNREEALWRLQKVTPIIATLDKPEPPFDVNKPSKILFGILGLFIGVFLASVVTSFNLGYKYVKFEIHQAVFGSSKSV